MKNLQRYLKMCNIWIVGLSTLDKKAFLHCVEHFPELHVTMYNTAKTHFCMDAAFFTPWDAEDFFQRLMTTKIKRKLPKTNLHTHAYPSGSSYIWL